MDATSHSLWTVLQEYVQRISVKWVVAILLLISMALQLVLVVLGACRYKSSRAIFRFLVWGAYISADAVAVSTLGTMMHSCAWSRTRSDIYGIWAPVLLLHLGGPDAITAYSVADNELWLRHGFNMVYQVLVAIYIIYSSQLGGHALVAATFLLVAGATKYGERTIALWFASDSQIVTSCLPTSTYLKETDAVKDRGYVITGEKKLQRMIEKNLGDIEAGRETASLKGRGVVTTKDVQADTPNNGEDYNLCLAYALFKMYMRRFVSLYFDEGDRKETREFWLKFSGKEAFRIVETELKFMYDALFSKGSGTAFSTFGIVLRLINCLLVGAAGFLILREREAQRAVTYVVISVALVVELFQFCRIVTSDWTRVRLICAQVEEITHPLSKVIETVLLALGMVQRVVGGDKYWSNVVHQNDLIETSFNVPRFVWKMAKYIPKADLCIASLHVHKVAIEEGGLKDLTFNIIKQKCSTDYESETCRDVIYNFEEDLLEDESEIREVKPSHDNLGQLILVWHIATTICQRKREADGARPSDEVHDQNVNYVICSVILSRYCAYLLVSRPRLLPVHPDMAGITYMQLVRKLMDNEYYGKDATRLLRFSDQSVLGSGTELARKLLNKEETARWKLMAEYWAGLVIYISVYNKASFHAECLADGGEFLSQLWVLVGHMGCGEQSDSAVRKKVEMPMEGERRRIRLEWLRQDRERRERLEQERRERRRRKEREEHERLEQANSGEEERLQHANSEEEERLQRRRREWSPWSSILNRYRGFHYRNLLPWRMVVGGRNVWPSNRVSWGGILRPWNPFALYRCILLWSRRQRGR